MSSASLQSLADDALSVLAADDDHERALAALHDDGHEEADEAEYAAERESELEQQQFDQQQQDQDQQQQDQRAEPRNPAHAQSWREDQTSSQQHNQHEAQSPLHRSPLSLSRSSYRNDAIAAVADVYTNLSFRGGRSASPQPPLESGSGSAAAAAASSSVAAASAAAAAAAHADALASPQPVRPAPRPHSQPQPQQSSSLDDQFEQSRLQQQQQRGGGGGDRHAFLSASARSLPPFPAAQPARAMSFSTGRASAPPLRPALPPASILAATMESHSGRARWAEQKRFLLTRLGHALRSKGAEVSRRAAALHADQPACERQLLATLAAYVRRTERTLGEYSGDIEAILSRVDQCAQRLEAEMQRFDPALPAPAHAGEDAQSFASVAHELEEQLQSILSAVAARDNFKLDGGSGGGGGGGGGGDSGGQAPALPAFDPFQVARVRALEAENARLTARVNELQLGAAQVVDVGATAAPSLPGGALVLAGAAGADAPATLGARQLVSLHETQGIILSLQTQLEQLTSAHGGLQAAHERLSTEHASVLAQLRHERIEGQGAVAAMGARAAHLESALRAGEKDSQALARALQDKTHQHSAAAAALAALESSSAAAALSFQQAQSAHAEQLSSLRSERAREFEQDRGEIRALHTRIEALRKEHEASLGKLQSELAQQSKQEAQGAAAASRAEIEALQERLREAQVALEKARGDFASERRKALEQSERQAAETQAAHAQAKNAAAAALASSQRDCAARAAEVQKLREELANLRGKAEARGSTDAAAVARHARAVEEQKQRGDALAREAAAAQTELKAAQRGLEHSRQGEASLAGEVAQLRTQALHAQDQARDAQRALSALQDAHAELGRKRAEEMQAAREAAEVAATQSAKLHAAQLALDLAETRAADLVRAGETVVSQGALREEELGKTIRQMEERALANQKEWESARARLEAQTASLGASLRAAEAAAASARDQAQRDLARFAQLQHAATDSSRGESERLRAQMDVQLEVAMTRFVGGHSARLDHLCRAIGEHAAVAANLGLWTSDASSVAEEAAAVTTALRQAVQPPSLSPFDGPVHSSGRGSGLHGEHKVGESGGGFGGGGGIALAGSLLSLAPQSLPSATLRFEGLVSQVESLLLKLLSNAQEGKRRAGERYQAMISRIERRARDRVGEAERAASKRMEALRSLHTTEVAGVRNELRGEMARLRLEQSTALQRCEADRAAAVEALENQVALERSEKESVAAQAAAEGAAAQEAIQAHTAEFEAHIARERAQAQEHCAGLLARAEDDFEAARRGWDEERSQLDAQLAIMAQQAAEADAAWKTKLAGSEQEAQERLQALRDVEERHRAQMREQGEKHRAAMADSLALYERKAALELDLLREESRAALDRAGRDASQQIQVLERANKDALDAAELRYVSQLSSLQSEHEVALSEALGRASEAQQGAEERARAQADAAMAVAGQMAQAQEDALRSEHARALEHLRREHEEEMAAAQLRGLEAVRGILLGQLSGSGSDGGALRISVALDASSRPQAFQHGHGHGDDESLAGPRGGAQPKEQRHLKQRRAAPAALMLRASRDGDHEQHQHYEDDEVEEETVPEADADADALVTHRSSADRSDVSEASSSSSSSSSSVPSSASAMAHRTARAEAAAQAGGGSGTGAGVVTTAASSGRPRAQQGVRAHEHRSVSPSDSESSASAALPPRLAPGAGNSGAGAGASGALVPRSHSHAHSRGRTSSAAPSSGASSASLAALERSVHDAARATAARVEELQHRLESQSREKDRLVAEIEERHEGDIAELRSTLAMAKSQLEETQSQLQHHKSHAESLSERWKSLSEAHEQLQALHAAQQARWETERQELERRGLERAQQLQEELAQLQQKQAETEAAMAAAAGESTSAREDLVSAHNAERRRWESLLQSRGEESLLAQQAALAEVEASHQRVLALARAAAEETLAGAVQACEARFAHEHAQFAAQVSEIATLSQRISELQGMVSAQDQKMAELHRAHLDDLRRRMDRARDARRAEVQEQVRWIADKMEAIKSNQLRREEALCKTCRQKLGSTSFRAALNRLCDEAVHFEHYHTLHHAPSPLPSSNPADKTAAAAALGTAAVATPVAVAATTPAQAKPLTSSVRAPRIGSVHANTNAHNGHGGGSASGSATSAFETSPGVLTAKYTSRAGADRASNNTAYESSLLTARLDAPVGVSAGAEIDAEFDALVEIDGGYDEEDFDGGASLRGGDETYGNTVPGARAHGFSSSVAPDSASASATAATPAHAHAAGDSRRGSVQSQGSGGGGSSTPLSRQEGVLTLRFHAPAPALAAQPETLVHATATFTPATAIAALPLVHTPASHSSQSQPRGTTPPFAAAAAANSRSSKSSTPTSVPAPAATATAAAAAPTHASARSLDLYLSKYDL